MYSMLIEPMIQAILPFLEISKLGIGLLVVLTTAVGFVSGSNGVFSYSVFLATLLGTFLSCAGAGALNNFIERDYDGKMDRTMHRPIPSGRLTPVHALAYGILLTVVSTTFLVWRVNLLCGFLALMTAFLYALVYTPLKRITWLNTTVGAIPGALPIMGGWAAATGTLSIGAWILFLIMFIWQHPHFYSIAWRYRDDYQKAGYMMLSSADSDGKSMFRHMIVFSLLLIPASLLPVALGMSGMLYFYAAAVLSIMFFMYALIVSKSKNTRDAVRFFHFSIVYLPMLLTLIVLDK